MRFQPLSRLPALLDPSEIALKAAPSLLSVIVPAFNEEGSICRCVEELSAAIRKAGCNAEIIVVNDGSTDRTLSAVTCMRTNSISLRVLSFSRNYGKATALREGTKASKGTRIAFFDADLQYDPADLIRAVSMLNDGSDVVTGLRDYRHYNQARTVVSKIYNRLLRLIFRLDVRDLNCGMKVLKQNAADPDFLFRYGVPLMIPLLRLRGFNISEKAVSLRERQGGESKFFTDGSFLGGWKNVKDISYHSVMLLGLLASLPSRWINKSLNPNRTQQLDIS